MFFGDYINTSMFNIESPCKNKITIDLFKNVIKFFD